MGNIIWLASYPRSGNIWLQSFLHNLLNQAQHAPTAEEIGGFCTPETAALHFMAPDSRPLGEWSWQEVAARRGAAHKAITELRSDNVFASTRAALAESGGAPTITMDYTAAAIYLVRNPLDLAVSLAAQGEQTIDQAITRLETEFLSKNSDQFAYECHGSWSTHVLSWTQQRHAGLHLLRYEDMLSAPENAFSPLATFMGLDVPPERLAQAIHFSSFSELAAEEKKSAARTGSGPPGGLLRVGKSEQWRDVLSADQARRIVEFHGEQMERFGYIPDNI
jgi:hypothetical protein